MGRETAASPVKHYYRNSAPVTGAPLTLSAWAYTTSSTLNQNVIVLNNTTGGSNDIGIALEGNRAGDPLGLYSGSSAGVVFARTANSYNVNAWNHCCGVVASSTDRKAYLNGDLANKGTNTSSSTPTSIGRTTLGAYFTTGASGSDALVGGLAECAIWNTNLNEDEIVSLSKGISAFKVRPQSLVFYFPGIREVIDFRNSQAITSIGSPGVIAHPRVY